MCCLVDFKNLPIDVPEGRQGVPLESFGLQIPTCVRFAKDSEAAKVSRGFSTAVWRLGLSGHAPKTRSGHLHAIGLGHY